MDTYYKLFGKELVEGYKPLILKALNESEGSAYTFASSNESKRDINRIYMSELVYRAHFGAASSLARNLEWIKGMALAYEQGVYLPFASAFRSLIESTGDSSEALINVAKSLTDNHKIISGGIAGELDYIVTINELEDMLIHYSHGRRLDKNDDAAPTHKAQSTAHYVNSLEKQTEKEFYACYSELCQLTHPAAESVLHLMVPNSKGGYIFSQGDDKKKIEELMSKYQHIIVDLLMFAFNPGLLILKTLNYLPVKVCHSNSLRNANFSWLPAWNKCEQALART
ncbi:hypothetical protein CXF83_12830 [Shewanella sp. Choline-02u-19]|uniref:hypothetical protein n=1 Tax=unclassified Shewanella TaxID=196818 RepID=UPI000C34CFAB|nr:MULTISPECIES: hypothetical protein [unclassified Shewanella]PKH56383.1 hypothetical protein CXF84_13885 [Shewanella sp. Bg11-22]PKI27522.1 hypothetical protein CXF83_12830 [Shewanella sp. Choline-02u-19]